MTRRSSTITALLALVFFAWHLRMLPRALEDPDSINFAMAVESFDVSRHQPHPPGYGVYVALTKASTAVVGRLLPRADRDRRAAVGLAIWSLLAGAAGAFVLTRFWIAVGLPTHMALLAALLAMASPLYAMSSVRPLTDMLGLVSAVAVQTGLLTGWRRFREQPLVLPQAWVASAFAIGLVSGIRSQTLWLTAPLAAWAVWELARLGRWKHVLALTILPIAGLALWLVPTAALSGGMAAYLQAIGAQGSEDMVGVEMLSKIPTLDMLRYALSRTFLVPWHRDALGHIVALCGLIGFVRLARRGPSLLAALGLAFWPYLVLHLTFQEVLYTRYALPLIVPVTGLAVVALAGLAGRFAPVAVLGLATAGVVLAQPDLRAYATEIAPLSAAARDMIERRASLSESPELTMHHPLWWSSRRTLNWYGARLDVPAQPFPGDREWLRVAHHFTRGDRTPVWFLADVTRSDLALIDPRAVVERGAYIRQPSLQRLIGGDLMEDTRWLEITPPRWILGHGWALTPEIAGVTALERSEPHRRAADAWMRRAAGPHRLMVGGRRVGGSGEATIVISLDGRELTRWTVAAQAGSFLRWHELADGALAGDSPYAHLTVSVLGVGDGSAQPELELDQFDAAPEGEPMFGLADGWQEAELNPATGKSWRWSSASNTITLYGGGDDVRLRLAGESPLKYFSRAPTLRVSVAGEDVARMTLQQDFDETVTIPGRLLGNRPTTVTISSDESFVPAESGNSPDQRRLGIRFFAVELRP